MTRRFSLLALALLPACYSLSLMQDPKPVPPGTLRANAGMAFNSAHFAPAPSFGLRVGLIPQVEARVKLTLLGENNIVQSLQLGYDIELPLSKEQSLFFMPYYRYDNDLMEDQDGVLDEAVYPHHTIHAFALPVLFVQHFDRTHFFLGPEIQAGTRDGASFLAIGGHVGLSIAAGRRVHFTPEFALLTVVDGVGVSNNHAYSGPVTLLALHDVIAEFALSVSFGAIEE